MLVMRFMLVLLGRPVRHMPDCVHRLGTGAGMRRFAECPDEFFGIGTLLSGHMLDLVVDGLGRHLLQQQFGQELLQDESPDATGDHDHEREHQRLVHEPADEKQPRVHHYQRHGQQPQPDMGPQPELRRPDPPGTYPLSGPEQDFEEDDQAARDAVEKARAAAAAGQTSFGGPLGDVGDHGQQRHRGNRDDPLSVLRPGFATDDQNRPPGKNVVLPALPSNGSLGAG